METDILRGILVAATIGFAMATLAVLFLDRPAFVEPPPIEVHEYDTATCYVYINQGISCVKK